MKQQQAVGYEVRVYANGSLREIEMFRTVVDARVWASLMGRRWGSHGVGILLHAIGRQSDGLLCVLADLPL